jgi:hypothetical protein
VLAQLWRRKPFNVSHVLTRGRDQAGTQSASYLVQGDSVAKQIE